MFPSVSAGDAEETLPGCATETRRAALGVELDDEPFLERDGQRDLVALGMAREHALDLVGVAIQVSGWVPGDLDGLTDGDEVAALLGQADLLAGLQLRAGDV